MDSLVYLVLNPRNTDFGKTGCGSEAVREDYVSVNDHLCWRQRPVNSWSVLNRVACNFRCRRHAYRLNHYELLFCALLCSRTGASQFGPR